MKEKHPAVFQEGFDFSSEVGRSRLNSCGVCAVHVGTEPEQLLREPWLLPHPAGPTPTQGQVSAHLGHGHSLRNFKDWEPAAARRNTPEFRALVLMRKNRVNTLEQALC